MEKPRSGPPPENKQIKPKSVEFFMEPVQNNIKAQVVGGPALNHDNTILRKVLLKATLNQRSSTLQNANDQE